MAAQEMLTFALLNTFTDDFSGGNPAAVIELQHELPTQILQDIARNLNQPIHAFISSSTGLNEDDPVNKSATFNLRWFTSEVEMSINGHGTLAAAKFLLSKPEMVAKGVESIKFETVESGVITARKLDENWLELELPSTEVRELPPDEATRLKGVVAKAFGKKDLAIAFLGSGGRGFEHYLFVELDATENLGGFKVDTNAFTETDPFMINVVTTASPNPSAVFVSRMFAPRAGLQEDHVCGSAHCLLGPYWSQKRDLGRLEEMRAKQVSKRGGDLRVVWEAERNIVRLRGEVKAIATGELAI